MSALLYFTRYLEDSKYVHETEDKATVCHPEPADRFHRDILYSMNLRHYRKLKASLLCFPTWTHQCAAWSSPCRGGKDQWGGCGVVVVLLWFSYIDWTQPVVVFSLFVCEKSVCFMRTFALCIRCIMYQVCFEGYCQRGLCWCNGYRGISWGVLMPPPPLKLFVM